MAYTTSAARWRALSIRDPASNNHFVYTVKSTNIYCRPTCPARLARRANVGFCRTPTEAAAAGFRPCKRCKPDVCTAAEEDPQEKAVARACALIEEAVGRGDGKAVRLRELARGVGLTPRYFHRIFKERRGVSPREWAKGKMQARVEDGGRGGVHARTPPLVQDCSPELEGFDWESFDWESFDFNEFVDLDGGAGLGVDASSTTAIGEPSIPGGFGDENDVNTSTLPWGIFASEALDPGFYLGDDKLHKRSEATAMWGPPMAMTTTSTFEQDAALILEGGYISGLNPEMSVGTLN